MTEHDHDDSTLERRKATLYCWECDHASPVDGDWDRRTRGRAVTYVCPDCETSITERPRTEVGSPTTAQFATSWARVVRASANVWRTSFDAGLSGMTAMARYRWGTA